MTNIVRNEKKQMCSSRDDSTTKLAAGPSPLTTGGRALGSQAYSGVQGLKGLGRSLLKAIPGVLQSMFWGPQGEDAKVNPWRNTLTRSLLLAPVGYGAARLASRLDPKGRFDPHRAGIVGAASMLPLAAGGSFAGMATDVGKLLGRRPLKQPDIYDDIANIYEQEKSGSLDMENLRKALNKRAALMIITQKRSGYGMFDTPSTTPYGETGAFASMETWLPLQRKGSGFPAHTAKQEILNDPTMSQMDRGVMVDLIDRASSGRSGLIGWPEVAGAAKDVGIGWVQGRLAGMVLDGMFGGISAKTHRRLQQAGMLKGLLKNTGVLR